MPFALRSLLTTFYGFALYKLKRKATRKKNIKKIPKTLQLRVKWKILTQFVSASVLLCYLNYIRT